MLTPDERDRLIDAIAMTAEVMGQEISVNMLTQMADDLAEYSEGQLALALRACRHEIKGKLTLKDIVDRIDDGRPPREEAWSIALASLDEEDTVAWTEEITGAITACETLMHSRDKVAARMAFLQAYDPSNRVPLAMMWQNGLHKPGRKVDDWVSFIDLAPTLIELAGLKWDQTGMAAPTGRSLTDILFSEKSGLVSAARDHVLIGKERHDVGRPHDWGYPIRGIIKGALLYLRNYETNRWPAGHRIQP